MERQAQGKLVTGRSQRNNAATRPAATGPSRTLPPEPDQCEAVNTASLMERLESLAEVLQCQISALADQIVCDESGNGQGTSVPTGLNKRLERVVRILAAANETVKGFAVYLGIKL